jgi:hypothetical protein
MGPILSVSIFLSIHIFVTVVFPSSLNMTWTLYYYTPSAAAAGIFVGLFGVFTVHHFYQILRTRTWFMIPFLIGGIRKSSTRTVLPKFRVAHLFQLKLLVMSVVCSPRFRRPITALDHM